MYRYFLALRYLLSRPINLIGMAGVTVSVWALIVVVSVFSGFLVEVRKHIQSATSDLTAVAVGDPIDYDEAAAILRRETNVASCAPRIVWYGLLHAYGKRAEILPQVSPVSGSGDTSAFVSLLGIQPEDESRATGFRSWLGSVKAEHRVIDLNDPLPEREFTIGGETRTLPAILLSEKRLEREFIAPGSVVKITSARLNYTTPGAGQQLNMLDQLFWVAGAYSTRHHAFDDTNCFVHIDQLRELSASGGSSTSEIVVRCVDPTRNEETARALQRTVDTMAPGLRLIVRSWQDLNEPILSAVDHQRSLMKLVLFVIMVVAAFLMYATLSMMVTEKTRDIGILTAMGGTRRGVAQVFLSCGLAIVIFGTVLGSAVGCLSSIYLDNFNTWLKQTFGIDLFPTSVYNLDRVPYDLDPMWIGQVAVMALGLGVLVAGVPAWRAARHDPLHSLRAE